MKNNYWSEDEADTKIGKLIVTMRSFSNIPIGTVGKVARKYGDKNKWGLDIEWVFVHTKRLPLTDSFSKDEYEEFLLEID